MNENEKEFDCVRMKQDTQAELLRRYELDKAKFPSYGDFLRAVVAEDDWARETLRRFAAKQTKFKH